MDDSKKNLKKAKTKAEDSSRNETEATQNKQDRDKKEPFRFKDEDMIKIKYDF